MGNVTKKIPKCLIKINGEETILGRQLKFLERSNIKDIVITVGPYREKIENFCGSKFSRLDIKYVYNSMYKKTNYIYSMYLIENLIDADVLLLHGDLVFEEIILRRIVNSRKRNCAYARRNNGMLGRKDFKAILENAVVKKISVDLSGNNVSDFMPLYKFQKQQFKIWLDEINAFIRDSNVKVYAEDALNNVLSKIRLEALEYQDELFTEIDDMEDLNFVKRHFNEPDRIL